MRGKPRASRDRRAAREGRAAAARESGSGAARKRVAAASPEPRATGRELTFLRIAIAAIVTLAIALRVWRVRHGLPDFTEEAIPFKRAFDMWGWESGAVDWNPHLFHYPSLSFYLHFFVQKLHFAIGSVLGLYRGAGDYFVAFHTDPTPMVVLGRLLGILADAATVAATAVIGERARRGAGLAAAFLVAISPTMILDARSIYTDPIMTALSMWAIERMLVYAGSGRRSTLVSSAILIGLAAGAKYPAALLVFPLGWMCWRRNGSRGLAAWAGASAGAFLVFLFTSPYIVLDFEHFASDFAVVRGLPASGHLGSLEHAGFLYYTGLLTRSVGWPGLALLIVSLAWTFTRARRSNTGVTLWIALLLFGLPISLGRIEAERYLIPIVPLAASLISLAIFESAALVPRRWRAAALATTLAALGIPVVFSGFAAAASGEDTTQLAARRWLEGHLGDRELLIQEAFGAELPTKRSVRDLSMTRAFQAARPEARERFLSRRTFRSVSLPLAVAGRAEVTLRWKGRAITLRLFPHISDLNRFYYEPALLEGVDYFLTSSAVRGRFEADSMRDSVQVRLYRLLDSSADTAAVFRATGSRAGPTIVIYRLGERAQRALRERSGALDPLWWAARVPMEYRRQVQSMAPEEGPAAAVAMRNPDGTFTAWMRSLRTLFAERLRDFAYDLSLELTELGRTAEAERLAASIISVDPGDVPACGLFVASASRNGEWGAARSAMEAMLSVRDPSGRGLPGLRIEYAQVLAQAGDRPAARRELTRVIEASPSASPVALRARTMLEALESGAGARSSISP